MSSQSLISQTSSSLPASTKPLLESPLFLQNHELRPDAPFNVRWRERDPLIGYHAYLVERVQCLDLYRRRVLALALHQIGWPLHLRSMDNAALKIRSGSPWHAEDEKVLKLLQQHFALPNQVITAVFFEGRTEEECEQKLAELVGTIGREEIDQLSKDDAAGKSKVVEVVKSEENEMKDVNTTRGGDSRSFAKLEGHQEVQQLKHREGGEIGKHGSRGGKRLPNSSPTKDDREQQIRSETPQSVDSKKWENSERGLVFQASQKGMTGKVIQQKYFSNRTVAAVQTRMSVEKKARGLQPTPDKRWSSKDRTLLAQLVRNGNSFQDISAKYMTHKTAKQCEAYHHYLIKSKEVTAIPTSTDMSTDKDILVKKSSIDLNEETVSSDGTDPDPRTHMAAVASRGAQEGLAKFHQAQTSETVSAANHQVQSSSSTSPYTENDTMRSHRDDVLESLDPIHLSPPSKTKLKKVLDATGWPKRFTSLSEYNAPLAKQGESWLLEDSRALKSIRNVTNVLPFKVIAGRFFPGRSENAVRNHYGSLRRAEEHAKGAK